MPEVAELKELVKEFRAQGVSDEEIRKALVEMDVEPSVVEQLLGGGEVEEHAEKEMVEEVHEAVPQPEKIEVEPVDREFSETLPAIEAIEHVKEVKKKVEELHTKVATVEHTVDISSRLMSMELDIKEIKAQLQAVKKLLQEILNTERNILLDLYERAKK